MADNVRAAVYSAEQTLRAMLDRAYEFPTVQVHGSTIMLPSERKFADIESIQRYVDSVLKLNWVRDAYANARIPVKVRERKGQRFAHYERWTHTIAIPPHIAGKAWAMRELVVIHELAHHLDTNSGHSSSFTETFCDLVSELMSAEAGFLLRTLFYDEGCKVG